MFDRIAPRYDLLNRVLSLGTDLSWRRRALDLARLGEGSRALDVGTGTGDFARALLDRRQSPGWTSPPGCLGSQSGAQQGRGSARDTSGSSPASSAFHSRTA